MGNEGSGLAFVNSVTLSMAPTEEPLIFFTTPGLRVFANDFIVFLSLTHRITNSLAAMAATWKSGEIALAMTRKR